MFFLGTAIALEAKTPMLNLKLKELEIMAVDYSPNYKSAEWEEQEAYWNAEALKTQLKPRVTLDSSFRYQTEVPELQLVTGMGAKRLGDNDNYSVGPSLQWIIWDKGALSFAHESGIWEYKARQQDSVNLRKQILLNCRRSYFALLLACEQSILIMDSLETAVVQYNDIMTNVRAGAKSRYDELSSHQEVLIRKRQLSEARMEIAESLRGLSKLTGAKYTGPDLLYPMDARRQNSPIKDIESPSHYIVPEKIETLFERFGPYRGGALDASHPASQSVGSRISALEKNKESLHAQKFPKLIFSARSSYDYPNGAVTEEVFQNMAGIAFSMPLFEDRQTEKKEKQAEAKIKSLSEKQKDVVEGLQEEWSRIQDGLKGLEEQKEINLITVREAQELADIVYKSYKVGTLTYVEVQNANLRALEAHSQLVRTEIQMLLYLAELAYLKKGED